MESGLEFGMSFCIGICIGLLVIGICMELEDWVDNGYGVIFEIILELGWGWGLERTK